jgi:hypothetical protein
MYVLPELLQQDCIVLSMAPPDPIKSPFRELRLVVPVRLTTNPFTPDDGTGAGAYSVPSAPEEDGQAELPYA